MPTAIIRPLDDSISIDPRDMVVAIGCSCGRTHALMAAPGKFREWYRGTSIVMEKSLESIFMMMFAPLFCRSILFPNACCDLKKMGKLEKIISKFNISKDTGKESLRLEDEDEDDVRKNNRFHVAPFLWPWVPIIDLNIRTGRFVMKNRTTDSDIDRPIHTAIQSDTHWLSPVRMKISAENLQDLSFFGLWSSLRSSSFFREGYFLQAKAIPLDRLRKCGWIASWRFFMHPLLPQNPLVFAIGTLGCCRSPWNPFVDIKVPALAFLPLVAFEGGMRRNIPKFELQDQARVQAAAEALCKKFHPGAFYEINCLEGVKLLAFEA
ncbi:unnamed protein product [Camellia sinensis]